MPTRTQYIDARGSHRLRNAMRAAPRLKAYIQKTDHGVLIELSDGRHCSVANEHCGSSSSAIAAAVQWARRHGATSVEIDT